MRRKDARRPNGSFFRIEVEFRILLRAPLDVSQYTTDFFFTPPFNHADFILLGATRTIVVVGGAAVGIANAERENLFYVVVVIIQHSNVFVIVEQSGSSSRHGRQRFDLLCCGRPSDGRGDSSGGGSGSFGSFGRIGIGTVVTNNSNFKSKKP